MTPRITGKTEQLAVRVEHDTIARIDGLADRLSAPGLKLTRADVVRMALAEGVTVLEQRVSAEKRRK